MLVCHCRRVCHREVLGACESGANSVEEVGRACGAGTGCGGCHPLIEDLIQLHQRREADRDAAPGVQAPAA
ncbi:MAG: (2Fe-2S)-binding protein [Polyangiaceae bacterium]|nr:(2Fe-2S)-binding protein [Polyangiaceae bacterium]MBK8997845.1 (2Fe-2S)-binding protein [Myxococcales bacterium]MCE7890068.1 (2Fe-2S)-binding protein [Sorangiineae bacterium PRO1]MCL4755032.1 (2Fe-2S)-binding protein [Myxococcales bacterium]